MQATASKVLSKVAPVLIALKQRTERDNFAEQSSLVRHQIQASLNTVSDIDADAREKLNSRDGEASEFTPEQVNTAVKRGQDAVKSYP